MPEQTQIVVKGIQSVYLPAADTKESAGWYLEHLGLKLIRPIHENQVQLAISDGQTLFLIKSREPMSVNYTEVGGTEQCILTIEVENLLALHKKMKQNGAHVTEIDDNGSCGLNFYAYDPAGNKLDIWSGWPNER